MSIEDDGVCVPEAGDGELIAFVADARKGLERRIAGAHVAAFEDAIARAHAMRPDVVDAATLADAQRLAPVVDLQQHAMAERALDELVADVRAALETKLRATRNEAPRAVRSGSRTSTRIGIAVALAAAAAALLIGSLSAERPVEVDQDADVEQAQLVEEGRTAVEHAPHLRPRAQASELRAPTPEQQVHALPIEPPPKSARPVTKKLRPSLAELAALAKTQWREGDLAAAQSTLRRIVERGGTTRWADNALSDLFALAHRQGDLGLRRHWWRVYLHRFPRGRFADDAYAGLCRTSPEATCWAQYLERFPRGSYRHEAEIEQRRRP